MSEENSEFKRWEKAQVYEKNWWKNNVTRVGINYYEISAEEIRKYYNSNSEKGININTKILEIGSGAVGILTFLSESNCRFGIDPLEYYYATIPEFKKARDEKVKYSSNKGEELPFENNYFDLIIMDNVLDHCQSPNLVFSEMDRVLAAGGVVYFRQNTYNYYGKYFRYFMELFQIDKGHPYSFNKTELKNKFSSYNLKIIASYSAGYFSTWKKEISSKSFKDIVKAVLLVTRNKVTFILKK